MKSSFPNSGFFVYMKNPSEFIFISCAASPWLFSMVGTFLPQLHINTPCSLVTKSCPSLWDPMGCNLPRSSVHGIFQARILAWFAISFSRESFPPRGRTHISCIGRWSLHPWASREAQCIVWPTGKFANFVPCLGQSASCEDKLWETRWLPKQRAPQPLSTLSHIVTSPEPHLFLPKSGRVTSKLSRMAEQSFWSETPWLGWATPEFPSPVRMC